MLPSVHNLDLQDSTDLKWILKVRNLWLLIVDVDYAATEKIYIFFHGRAPRKDDL